MRRAYVHRVRDTLSTAVPCDGTERTETETLWMEQSRLLARLVYTLRKGRGKSA